MPAPSALDALADELGAVAGRIEREAGLRIGAALSDLKRHEAESELRLAQALQKLDARLAEIKDGEPGTSVTIEEVGPLVEREVDRRIADLPAPQPAKGVTVEDLQPVLAEMVAALPPAEPGKSVTLDDVRPLIDDAVAKLPPAEPGKSVTVEDVRPMLEEMVADIPKPKDGKDGEPGSAADTSVVPDDIAEQISKAVTLLAESPAANALAPIVLNINSERSQKPLTKTITTRREGGNLVADVVEH